LREPACEIEPAEALRVCDFFDRPLAISFWFTKGGDCLPSQDAFDRVARRYEDRVNFLSINVRDSRETVESIIEEREWSVPVGLDPDGAVSNLYRVGLCPTIALAYEGGILQSGRTGGGDYTEAEIERFVRELLAASRERAETSR
jgi:cytochrome c biogenesis protein CcmG, thiol:disulfide interchange protein DsbE